MFQGCFSYFVCVFFVISYIRGYEIAHSLELCISFVRKRRALRIMDIDTDTKHALALRHLRFKPLQVRISRQSNTYCVRKSVCTCQNDCLIISSHALVTCQSVTAG